MSELPRGEPKPKDLFYLNFYKKLDMMIFSMLMKSKKSKHYMTKLKMK
tara:strand:+ start:453 stop:596 length:144 start_codon:yes stop_codon:yes gene_type:complete